MGPSKNKEFFCIFFCFSQKIQVQKTKNWNFIKFLNFIKKFWEMWDFFEKFQGNWPKIGLFQKFLDLFENFPLFCCQWFFFKFLICCVNSRNLNMIAEIFFRFSLFFVRKKPQFFFVFRKKSKCKKNGTHTSQLMGRILKLWKKYAEFGTINWKTEICFIKNSQNGNVYIGEKWKNISNKNISLV